MSTYEYTDHDGDKLSIEPGPLTGHVIIGVTNSYELNNVGIKPEDAPAVALALLEAAGAGAPDESPHNPQRLVSDSVILLRESVKRHAQDTEREAEDTKVREFVAAIPGVSYLDESEDHWRHLYRAARDHFTRAEQPAPRVLNHGDPEPDFGSRWRDTAGHLWAFGNTCHRNYPVWRMDEGASWGRWSHLDSCFFPMTEVTE